MLRAYEGYFEKGRFYPVGASIDIQGRRRVILTVLDDPPREKSDTWAELDKIVSGMDAKPRFEDFPRCQLKRELIDFEEA